MGSAGLSSVPEAGNPWGKGESDVQNCAGRANWRCTVVTKDWFIGKWQHKTVNFGGNISIRFWIFAANEHATYVKCSACALKGLAVRRPGLTD